MIGPAVTFSAIASSMNPSGAMMRTSPGGNGLVGRHPVYAA